MLESDPIINEDLDISSLVKPVERIYQQDMETIIATGRYDFIESIKSQTFVRLHYGDKVTERLDRLFLNKFLAIPIFALIMFMIYFLSVGVIGSLTVDLVDQGVTNLSNGTYDFLLGLGAHDYTASLVSDGIIRRGWGCVKLCPSVDHFIYPNCFT